MSSGNKLSVSICDDNGNLSYQKQYRVRRVLQRGVFRDEKGVIALNMNECGFTLVNNEWTATDSTGKIVFVMICRDSGCYNETKIGEYIPAVNGEEPRSVNKFNTYEILTATETDDLTELAGTTVYGAGILVAAGGSPSDPSAICIKGIDGGTIFDYDAVAPDIEHTGGKITEINIKLGCTDQNPHYDTFDRTRGLYVKTFRGKRWLCVSPANYVADFGLIWKIEQTKNPKGLEYYVLEVEE